MVAMSHTATCLEGHTHEVAAGLAAHSAPSVLDPSPTRAAARAQTVVTVLRLPEIRWSLTATALFAAAVLLRLVGAPTWSTDTVFGACYLAGGWEPALAGLHALRQKTLDVDLLMIVAAVGAASIGQVLDGGLLIVIFATSGALEAYATKRTADSVRALLTLAPERASLLHSDGSEQLVDTARLGVGDVIVVRPGEQIGADGTVVAGMSEVDQASITGEPLPVVRGVGDDVFAGTLNREGALRIAVSRPAADSVVARIVALVAEASATKAKAQLFIEHVEQRYSVGVVVTTLMVFGIPLAFGASLQPTLLRAMTYMIVASPCAVVLATMPPLLSAIANAGRHGVLVKSAVVMEQLGATTLVAFDKTGTLTRGTPRVSDVWVLPGSGFSESDALALAAGAERPSEHPLGRAVVRAALDRGLLVPDAADFTATPGRGVSARVDHKHVIVGAPAVLEHLSRDEDESTKALGQLEDQGRTAVVVVVDSVLVAVVGLVDQLRPQANRTVAALTRVTGREPVLLTGDNYLAAGRIGEEVGITDVRAGLLPVDKAVHVTALTREGTRVLVVGDGINDAPALAAAHIGVSMGRHGSDLTLQTADAVLVRDDLATLPAVIELSRRARRAVIQNLVLAGFAILGLVTWDLVGHLPLPLGVLGHEGGTVLIGLNGLRLLRSRAWASTPDI
ncbi:MAG: heavy metal translocating P-type ATPase [Acidimicrobiales bacterium]